ncbi:MAG: hypothetical protein AAGH90_12275 [Pseudomonadota bacterium]
MAFLLVMACRETEYQERAYWQDEVFEKLDRIDLTASEPMSEATPAHFCFVEYRINEPLLGLAKEGRFSKMPGSLYFWKEDTVLFSETLSDCSLQAMEPARVEGLQVKSVTQFASDLNVSRNTASSGIYSPHPDCSLLDCRFADQLCFREASGHSVIALDHYHLSDAFSLSELANDFGVPAQISFDDYILVNIVDMPSPTSETWAQVFERALEKRGEGFQQIDCPK